MKHETHITNKYILCARSSLNIQMAKESDRRVILMRTKWALFLVLCENIIWDGVQRCLRCAYYINAEMDAGDSTKENLRIESDQYQTRIMKK
jgi:hypothetical protein